MLRLLTLDAALARASAALVQDGRVLALRMLEGGRGQAAALPRMAEDMLAGVMPDMVAVTVGPGGFTGLRAALSLAHGIALGASIPLLPVTLAEVFAAGPALPGRTLWTAIDSRRGRVFLDRGGGFSTVALEALPPAQGPVAVAGDAAVAVAARLAATGQDVLLTDRRMPRAEAIAAAALRRHHGALPPLAAMPLYVDPPEARRPEVVRSPPR